MSPVRLVTLDQVALSGPAGPIAIADPRHLALLVRLWWAPGRALEADELLLGIWPHLTARQGEDALAAAARSLEVAAGGALVTREGTRWTLSGAVEADGDGAGPADAARFAAGLSLADTPEWDEWVATVRREIASRPAPAVRRPIRRAAWIGIAGVAAVAVAGYLVARPRPVEGFTAGDRVLFADVENATTDSSLGRSLRMAAEIGLRSSGRIELVARNRIGSPERLGVAEALQTAGRLGIPWVVSVAVAPAEGAPRVTLRLLRVPGGGSVFDAATTGSATIDLVEAFGEAMKRLDRRLGESRAVLAARPTLAFATTADLDALRAYTNGTTAWNRGDYAAAREHWDRAVALDSGFALAMGSLGSWHYLHHERARGEAWFRKALARIGRLTEWERLQIEQRYADYRGDHDSSLAIDRILVQRYPRAMTWSGLGTSLLQSNRCDEAIEPFRRAIAIDPTSNSALINLATCFKALRRFEEARTAYLDAERAEPGSLYRNNINLEFAGALLLGGRIAEAESALVRMSASSRMADKALGYRGLGWLALWRGSAAQARSHFRRAVDLSREQRASNSLVRNLALLAAADRAAGDLRAAAVTTAALDQALAGNTDLPPGFLALALEPLAAEEGAAAVVRLLGQITRRADPRSRDDSLLVHYATGLVAQLRHDPRGALASFDRAAGYRYPSLLAVRRAAAWLELDQPDSARRVLTPTVARPEFGSENQLGYRAASVQMGMVQERLGMIDDAIASYRSVLERWSGGDPDLPDLVLVRQRLNALLLQRDR